MTIFCTSCGHPNEKGNKICVECGKPLAVRASAETKKPMALKTKVLTAVIVLLLAGLGGLYSWGTKTASAETAVSKFFEALEKKDANLLAEHMALSNGKQVESKQAAAFMESYPNLTPYDLEQVATISQSGKVLGVFNAFKIVLPEQTASFEFPHEGLELHLDGKKVDSVEEEDGIYRFTGLVPGSYDAKFVYDGEYTEFTHSFELAIEMNTGSDETVIYEELPAESVVLDFGVFNETNYKNYKIIVGEKEFAVDATGATEPIGPLPLDGSLTAQGEIEFPWGKQVSEPLKIDSDYQTLEISKLSKDQESKLVEQLTLFGEQYTQALGTRDASVLKTATANQRKVFEEEFKMMKESNLYFIGSLTEIKLEEPSIVLNGNGESVSMLAELVVNGANYAKGDTVILDRINLEAEISFVYDADAGKWLVDEYVSNWFSSIEPTRTIKGSGKVYEVAGTAGKAEKAEAPAEVTEENFGISDSEIDYFFNAYNDSSVAAINSGDFGMVSSMVTLDGPRFDQQSKFVNDTYAKGITEEHLGTSVEKVEVVEDGYLQVTTIEKFIIHGTEKSSEKDYRTVTIIYVDGTDLYAHKLISTKEI